MRVQKICFLRLGLVEEASALMCICRPLIKIEIAIVIICDNTQCLKSALMLITLSTKIISNSTQPVIASTAHKIP
jgi:hypothetical protein